MWFSLVLFDVVGDFRDLIEDLMLFFYEGVNFVVSMYDGGVVFVVKFGVDFG